MSLESEDGLQDVRRLLHKVLEEESHLLMTQLRGEIAAELRALHSRELANFGLQLKHMMSEMPVSASSLRPRRSKPSSGASPNPCEASKTPDSGMSPTEFNSQTTASTASTSTPTASKEVARRDASTGEVVVTAFKMSCLPEPSAVSLVTHELRSPLNGLAGYARTLAETNTKYQKEFKLFMNTAQFALENVTNLIDLWTYAGKQIGDLVSDGILAEDLNDLTQERLSRTTTRKGKPLVKSGVAVEMAVDEPSLALAGDFTALTVLQYHLVANSVKFTERGEVSVKWARTSGGLMLTVQDTGIGMATKSMDRIFDPFEVEDKSESRKYEGIGLGLTVVREIARLHRAKLFVKSTKGEGSVFQVLFTPDSIVDAANVRSRPKPGLPGRVRRNSRSATSPPTTA